LALPNQNYATPARKSYSPRRRIFNAHGNLFALAA
jgi:hypothetical protein